ncbi:MAG: CPBP family intramembrane metalloprotease [Dorea sp.]|nr:CPBP family intramembrane metalloprotease [Dorea sp.]MCI9452721.1 CPBP family intramembrane metalloprotease [Dorea sp.]
MYLSFIGIWILTLLYLRFTKKNRPILKSIGRSAAGNNLKNLLLGFVLGFVLNGVCILAAWLHKDISLHYDSFRPVAFALIFIAVFVQSSAEELVCRGFLYQRLRQSYGHPAVAIIGNSLLFAILHLTNEGVTILSVLNIFIVGVLFSFMVYYMDSIWCAMSMHAMWNFTQNIIFGLPNSGIVSPYSVFRLDASTAKDSFAYNVGFGIEGTLLADVILILACICLYLWGKNNREKS